MNPEQARTTIGDTFRQKFDDARFLYFIRNLVNHLDESKRQTWTLKKAAFEDYVNHFTRLGTYTDPDGEKADVLVIYLRKDTTLARGRVTLRNFVADYLATGHGQGKAAVLAAFVSPQEDDWRFSFVKLDYTFEKTELGLVRERAQLTPARRYSYLVGANENCHTAQKQFLALLESVQINPTVAQLETAFSVEKVTKEFFEHYRGLFEKTRDALAAVLDSTPKLKQHFDERGIACDDFAKKLLGQIVFLYFLQKKGWFGVERGRPWGSGRKDFIRHLFTNRADYAHVPGQRKRAANFFNDILEPLFYEAIASPRLDDDHYYSRFDCRIPFLNGGLFEPLYGYNWVETEILLPDTLFANTEPTGEEDETGTGILDVFDRYNFTVNEAEPLEKEVAVDPEMLGKVFENLLPENIRHSSGTYYTPRVIVHYMCQQALLHYLSARAADIPHADLTLFLRLAERFADFEGKDKKSYAEKGFVLPESISQNAGRLDDLLAAITVCDLAVGSGAFVVGMMQEIVRARMALTPVLEGRARHSVRAGLESSQSGAQGTEAPYQSRSAYTLKRHAIQHSLYGVDLDPGAVEIAKLRLWLSMIVDEDELADIQPLPNLDYKIMQGNSLLEEFDGVRLLDDKLLQPPDAARDSEIAETKARITALSQEAIRHHGAGKKGTAQKLAAEQEIKRLKKRLATLLNPDEAKAGRQGELHQQTSWAKLKRIQELHGKFFGENSRTEKEKLRRELDRLEWDFMEATLREQGHTEAIAELKRASSTHRKPFFLWRLQFGEVFNRPVAAGVRRLTSKPGNDQSLLTSAATNQRCGFDVVIANPPYVRQEEIKEFKPAFQRAFECYTGTADLFVFFYERAVKLLRPGGALAFITSNKYYRAGYGEKLRGFLARELTLQQLIDFGDAPVFEAIAYASILTGTRNAPAEDTVALGYTWEKDVSFERIAQVIPERGQKISQNELKADGWQFKSSIVQALRRKIASAGVPLGKFAGELVFNGIKSGHKDAFTLSKEQRLQFAADEPASATLIKPLLRGRDIKRWRVEPTSRWLLYISWHFPYKAEDTIDPSGNVAEVAFRKGFPKVFAHLATFRADLLKRDQSEIGIRYEWFCLSRPRPESALHFQSPKIVFPDIAVEPSFAWDEAGHAVENTAYFIPAEKWLLGVLNSKAAFWFFRQISNTIRGGFVRFIRQYVEQIPIPAASPEKQKAVERLVDRILASKARDTGADVSALEREIDELVYALYGLTPEEKALVQAAAK